MCSGWIPICPIFLLQLLGVDFNFFGKTPLMTRLTHFSAAVLPPYAAICSGVSRFLSLLHEVSQSSAEFFSAKWCVHHRGFMLDVVDLSRTLGME